MNQKTKDLTFDWCKDAPDGLIAIAHGVDAKLVGILAAGSIVISVLAASLDNFQWCRPDILLLATATGSYLFIFIGTAKYIRPQKFERPSAPGTVKQYWEHAPSDVREKHWEIVEQMYANNLSIVDSKSRFLAHALLALGIETASLVAWVVVVATFYPSPSS